MTHRWNDPIYEDHATTRRSCKKCPIVKVSRHEPDNDPPHWLEWERDGLRFQSSKTPVCDPAAGEDGGKPVAKKKEEIKTEIAFGELRADNFKKLKAISIKPGGGVFEVAGNNEAGKSSVLDAFMAAIGGPKYFPPEPIRHGEEESLLQVDLGALVVVRRIWRREGGSGYGQEVVVQWADGKRPAKPQTVLDALRGSPIADDPVAFARLKPKDRLDIFRKLVTTTNDEGEEIPFDFETLAAERQDLFETRTQVGRDHDRVKAVVDSMRLPQGALTTEPVNVADLLDDLKVAVDTNAVIDRRAEAREDAADKIIKLRDEADALVKAAAAKNLEANELEVKLRDAGPLPDKLDVAAIQHKISSAEEVNAVVRLVQDWRDKIAGRDSFAERYEELSTQIAAIDERKKEAIAGAKLPVPGLGFGEEDITLDGLPFEQASSARRIRVATALLMALKPGIRVLLVREGSLLDDGMREALHQEAVLNKFVVLFETVGDGGGSGVVIRDGEIV